MAIALSRILVEVRVGRQFYKDCIYASTANTFLPIFSSHLVRFGSRDESQERFVDHSSSEALLFSPYERCRGQRNTNKNERRGSRMVRNEGFKCRKCEFATSCKPTIPKIKIIYYP